MQKKPFKLSKIAFPVLGLFWLLVTTLPFIFVAFTSFKSLQETYTNPVWMPPEHWNFDNYIQLLNGSFLTYLRNSVFVISVSVILIVLVSSMAAYALARLKFRFNNLLFG